MARLALGSAISAPPGFELVEDFIGEEEERRLAAFCERLSYGEVRMHGITAKRQVAHFGWLYGYESWQIRPGPPLPPILVGVRERAAPLAQLPAMMFEQCLVTRYPPGAQIGWHRDAPVFGDVVLGASIGGSCRMKLRDPDSKEKPYAVILRPRSLYMMRGMARWHWQHSIPASSELRYSITFRTLARR